MIWQSLSNFFLTMMTSSRSITTSFAGLSISPVCIRQTPRGLFQKSNFSTSPVILIGPIARLRRERAEAKLRKAKARAEQLRIQREAKADPVIGCETEFTKSLLRYRDILANDANGLNSRFGEYNWPVLTNFGIGSDDALKLAFAAKDAEKRRLAGKISSGEMSQQPGGLRGSDDLYEKQEKLAEEDGKRKREVMARLIDLTNATSRSVMAANKEKALIHFARFEGDTGSPEVQAGVMTVRILAMHDHLQRNRQDKHTKRALNMLVHQRQKMLKYLRRESPERYVKCIKEIGLDDIAIVREVR